MYGLACDYVVFVKVFSHHVKNLFPNVPVDARSTRIVGCPTFVYGLACDYVVFAEVFRHQVQNLFPNVLVEVCPGGLLHAPEVKKYSILPMDVDHILQLNTHIYIHLAMETNHSLFS